MATIQELVGLGEQMDLQGQELKDFVCEQQAMARATREAEREESAKQREAARKEKQFELEKLKLT